MSDKSSASDPQSDPQSLLRTLSERTPPSSSNESKWHGVRDALIGAVVGAVFAYAAAVYQAERATEARRGVLLKELVQELRSVPQQVPPYDVTQVIYRDPIRLSSIPLVLSGDIFEYPEDAKVVTAVLNLQIAINVYNDLVQTTNQAQALTTLPDVVHRKMYDDMANRHARVRQAKASLVEALSRR